MFSAASNFDPKATSKQNKKDLKLEDMQKGILKVLILRGKNIKADDGKTSNPYAVISVHSFDKEVKQ